MEKFLREHALKKPVSFHMPGHKGSGFYKRFGHEDFLDHFFDYDITEIEGADNLFQREGIIKAVSEKYARLYGAKQSFLLINGTSCGLIAAILATVPKGKKIIMARNSHKSVFNALTLAGIEPIYAYPELIEDWKISGQITPCEIEEKLMSNPDAEAVILPSPNYYGICSDVEKIAEVVHRFGKILIVDQAHGAHLNFFNEFGIEGFPLTA
ncbi:MAG: aminotransferase class I/II-fold pyridoxal phosphate-dependent enzyme, partial [Peptostreptococcaceae bacterium]|nr:aminotransferase class I/II-fold pyridoxal phosphate-dependent enzyme [Peptostreptococcaceae bacterium]